MATNVYFSQSVKSEQWLYEDIVIEALKMYGQDVYYIPRELIERDDLLNEEVESKFSDAYQIEMYIENTEGFEGEGHLLSKFGLEIRDQANFIVSKRRWEKVVGLFNNNIQSIRPVEGDLIYLPLSRSIFEIKFVEHEKPFYQLKNVPVYQLQCELFEYASEQFDTGVSLVDDIQREHAYTMAFSVDGSNGTQFQIGERAYQILTDNSADPLTDDVTISGEVTKYEPITSTNYRIFLADIRTSDSAYHTFVLNDSTRPLIGTDSGAQWNIAEIFNFDSSTNYVSDETEQNTQFENQGDSFLDFTEQNPFGEPT